MQTHFFNRFSIFILTLCLTLSAQARVTPTEKLYWLKVKATNKEERTALADKGYSLEILKEDYVVILGSTEQRNQLKNDGVLLSDFAVEHEFLDFPATDANFHNYVEMQKAMEDLAQRFPNLATLDSLGTTVEKREIWRLRISQNPAGAFSKPGIAFMGGHHAREHLSVEIPLKLAKYLLEEYGKGNTTVTNLVDNRDIHIIPMVNPDGAEYDVQGGSYKMWRKNRIRNSDGSMGVDLNRNYGYQWGTGGASPNPRDDTYRGPTAFSEPETQAIKNFFDQQTNISSFISFHSFSELILYPWGHSYSKIGESKDFQVFKTMADTMAKWNSYAPQQASELYIASGDTVDWAYGVHKVFGFTFELDPDSIFSGGFYPGQSVIPSVFQKNLQPCLYMIDLADNPYRVLNPTPANYGLSHLKID